MKLSEQWLREWVNPQLNTQKLAEQLTMAGLEVESVAPVANDFSGVVVGEVMETKPHPDADRLRVCQVNVGSDQMLNIVCGGANVRTGLKVPVAIIGAVLAPDLKIKKTKLRGVESAGMICSVSELGLAEASEGIMELPADAPVGMDLRKYLKLDDQILDLKITPNRGDCLSIAGIARELAVLNRCDITPPKYLPIPATINDKFSVKGTVPQECPHYVGRVIRQVNLNQPSPLGLQERLRRSGIRSINPVVDVTNYVMLELGQPLHAFDLNKLTDSIEVRLSKLEEKITLLDGQTLELDDKTLIIADAKQPHAIAGIMGGSVSGVTTTTTDIFLESAFFNPIIISETAKRYGLQSDSSQRFERGVDPQLQIKALERATELLLNIVGGKAGPVVDVIDTKHLPKPITIKLRRARIQRVLNLTLSDQEVENILQRLGMKLHKSADGWQVEVPSYRFDVMIEEDLLEELARIYGYQHIPVRHPVAALKAQTEAEAKVTLERFRTLLMDRDYREVITYSFIDPKLQKQLDPELKPLALANPLSQEMSVMRTNLWPGLIQAALYNQRRQEARIRLFETGLVFLQREDEELLQQPRLGGLVMGSAYPEQWGISKANADFFDVKSDVEALLRLTGHFSNFRFEPGTHPALHPYQAAKIYLQQQCIGYIGALHPSLEQALDIPGPVYLFELDLSSIQKGLLPSFKPISKFPLIRRDIAIIVSQEVSAQQVQDKIINTANELLKNVQIFDIYQGKGIDLGQKSIALGLTFQHPSRTLIDSEVNDLVGQITTALKKDFGAKLRE